MYDKELDAFAGAAVSKYEMSKKEPFKYLMSAMIAGFFIVVATVLSNVTAAVFFESSPATAKFLGHFCFPLPLC